jgi:hypothetical protein
MRHYVTAIQADSSLATMKYLVLLCCLAGTARADLGDCCARDGSLLAPGKTHSTNLDGSDNKYECTEKDRAFFEQLNQAKLQREENARLVARAPADAESNHAANLAYQAKQAQEAEHVHRALASLSDSLNTFAATKQRQAVSLGRSADDIGRATARYEAEQAAQPAQQQAAERQARQIAEQQPRPAAPARPDPLAPAPAPARTRESRRAAGLPDDPNAAACIQDDACARALLSKH